MLFIRALSQIFLSGTNANCNLSHWKQKPDLVGYWTKWATGNGKPFNPSQMYSDFQWHIALWALSTVNMCCRTNIILVFKGFWEVKGHCKAFPATCCFTFIHFNPHSQIIALQTVRFLYLHPLTGPILPFHNDSSSVLPFLSKWQRVI